MTAARGVDCFVLFCQNLLALNAFNCMILSTPRLYHGQDRNEEEWEGLLEISRISHQANLSKNDGEK